MESIPKVLKVPKWSRAIPMCRCFVLLSGSQRVLDTWYMVNRRVQDLLSAANSTSTSEGSIQVQRNGI